MGESKIVFHPIISSIQKIALYETKAVSICTNLMCKCMIYRTSFIRELSYRQKFFLRDHRNIELSFK